jgi:hypothetical protein
MKLGFFILVPFVLAAALLAQEVEQSSDANIQWWEGDNNYTLHLHDELTLQDCLNTGIHPRHVPGLAGRRLQFQAKSFTMILPNGNSVISKNGYGELTVSKDYQVTTIAFYETKFVGFENCLDRLVTSNQAYGGSITEGEINDFLASVRAAERHRTGKSFGVGRSTKDNSGTKYWSSSLVARNRGTKELPFRFIMRTEIRHKDKKKSPQYHGLGTLLKSPKGYEDISFAYIPLPSDPNAPPILTPQEQSKLLAKNLRSSSKDTAITQQDLPARPELSSKPLRKETKKSKLEKKPSRLPWIIAGVLLLGIIALVFRVFKGKSRS